MLEALEHFADGKVYQEFYCAKSGSGCGGYITVRLNMEINGIIEVVCPKCDHKHIRCIQHGVLHEGDRHGSKPVEEICPTMSAWHDKPIIKAPKLIKDKRKRERDAVIQTDGGRIFLAERWFEMLGYDPYANDKS